MKTKFSNSTETTGMGLLIAQNGLRVQHEEATDYKAGKQDEPDQQTKHKAYLWCKEFLRGAWKTLTEEEFQISIIRFVCTCVFSKPIFPECSGDFAMFY